VAESKEKKLVEADGAGFDEGGLKSSFLALTKIGAEILEWRSKFQELLFMDEYFNYIDRITQKGDKEMELTEGGLKESAAELRLILKTMIKEFIIGLTLDDKELCDWFYGNRFIE